MKTGEAKGGYNKGEGAEKAAKENRHETGQKCDTARAEKEFMNATRRKWGKEKNLQT